MCLECLALFFASVVGGLDRGRHLSGVSSGSMTHIVPATGVIPGASGQGSQQCRLRGRVRGSAGSQQRDLPGAVYQQVLQAGVNWHLEGRNTLPAHSCSCSSSCQRRPRPGCSAVRMTVFFGLFSSWLSSVVSSLVDGANACVSTASAGQATRVESGTSFGCARASCRHRERSRHSPKRGTGSDEIRALCLTLTRCLSWGSHTGRGSRHSVPLLGCMPQIRVGHHHRFLVAWVFRWFSFRHTPRDLFPLSQPEALVAGTEPETLSRCEEGEEEQLYFLISPGCECGAHHEPHIKDGSSVFLHSFPQ